MELILNRLMAFIFVSDNMFRIFSVQISSYVIKDESCNHLKSIIFPRLYTE